MASLKIFEYTNSKNETNTHAVYVISETPEYMIGIDLNKALELVVDRNDKDFRPADNNVHSPWCFNLVRLENADDEISVNFNVKLYELAAAHFLHQTEKPYGSFKDIVALYNDSHSKIDTDKIIDAVHASKAHSVEAFLDSIEDDDLKWFSVVDAKSNVLPGWEELLHTYEKMQEVLLNRDPTQYQSLQESRAASKKPIEGFDKEWMKAFKNFKKSGIKS